MVLRWAARFLVYGVLKSYRVQRPTINLRWLTGQPSPEHLGSTNTVGSKLQRKQEDVIRLKWHTRQKTSPTSQKLSKNKLFRQTKIDLKIKEYIQQEFLGRRRFKEMPKNWKEKLPVVAEFDKKYSFVAAASKLESFPDLKGIPEVAFTGRSNVGKSSLTINWYVSGHGRLALVDLPGYGFAFAKQDDKDAWQKLIDEYLHHRRELKRVVLLVDSRLGLKHSDYAMIDRLRAARVKFISVLTKADLVHPDDLGRRATLVQQELSRYPHWLEPLLIVSAQNHTGLAKLQRVLASLALARPNLPSAGTRTPTTTRSTKPAKRNTAATTSDKHATMRARKGGQESGSKAGMPVRNRAVYQRHKAATTMAKKATVAKHKAA